MRYVLSGSSVFAVLTDVVYDILRFFVLFSDLLYFGLLCLILLGFCL